MALVVKQEIEFKRNKTGSGSYKRVAGTTPTSEDNALTPVNTDLKTLDEERHQILKTLQKIRDYKDFDDAYSLDQQQKRRQSDSLSLSTDGGLTTRAGDPDDFVQMSYADFQQLTDHVQGQGLQIKQLKSELDTIVNLQDNFSCSKHYKGGSISPSKPVWIPSNKNSNLYDHQNSRVMRKKSSQSAFGLEIEKNMAYISSTEKLHLLYQDKLQRQTKELNAVIRSNDRIKLEKANIDEQLAKLKQQQNTSDQLTKQGLIREKKQLQDSIGELKEFLKAKDHEI